jgi:quercetin dioxygenase-like cupin family protein
MVWPNQVLERTMIVKSANAKFREFYGVQFQVLAIGPESMVCKMLYKKTDSVPTHSHPNEQSGYVISGKYRLKFGQHDQILEPGDSYAIPKNAEHGFEIIEAGEVIDVFTPVRQDYL